MSRSERLGLVLALNLVLVLALLAVGATAHSISVVAEGADYLADAAAIGVSLLAIWLSERPRSAGRPPRFPRATTFAALVNAGWLLLLSLAVIVVATHRLVTGVTEVKGGPVLVVSAIAAAVMFLGALILRGDGDGDGDDVADDAGKLDADDADNGGGALAMRAVLLDTVADASAAAGVAVTGAVIALRGGWYWLDPAVALGIAAVVAVSAARLLVQIGGVLRSSRA